MAFTNISHLAALSVLVLLSLNEFNVQYVYGHGRLLEPPNRASLFRFPEFSHLNPPENYEFDNELFCGGFETQYSFNGGKCGICGDPYNETVPRSYEDGGRNYTGIIVRGYRSGDIMPVQVQLTASHYGYLEFRLCAMDDTASHLNQECYDQHLLKVVNRTAGADGQTKYVVPVMGEPYWAQYSLELPKGVSCKHCVLQWHYQTGNNWGTCADGTVGRGCGDQEVFRGCSDIIIYPEDTEEENIDRKPNSKYPTYPPEEPEDSSVKIIEESTTAVTVTSSTTNTTTTASSSTGKLLWFNNNIRHYIPS